MGVFSETTLALGAAAAGWSVAGWLAWSLREARRQSEPTLTPELKLEQHRRSEKPAIVAIALADGADPKKIDATFRATDGCAVLPTGLIVAVMDELVDSQPVIEHRLAEIGVSQVGWARYPDDGWTLNGLIEAAQRKGLTSPVKHFAGDVPVSGSAKKAQRRWNTGA